eukprot:TRINITY_DN12877_c0_g1_i2.p1 TRINITY_DN12877_c0_g1~~TRINITY_DN12877_c0_g1_i2.p1  ORF type:complete len:378 (+),score=70.80 TRINITY_DN12877_c0_g1_i2:103-1236(+)
MRRLLLLAAFALLGRVHAVVAPECPFSRTSSVNMNAVFFPGHVTIDGDSSDWLLVEAAVEPTLRSTATGAALSGKVTLKAIHDGTYLSVLLQVPALYSFSAKSARSNIAVGLILQIGQNSTLTNLGGCTSATCEDCIGRETDVVQFLLNETIPGQLIGASPGTIVDSVAVSSICQKPNTLDSDWVFSWSHSTLPKDDLSEAPSSTLAAGTYTFEMQRKLRPISKPRQDARLIIGQSFQLGVAVWMPDFTGGTEWLPLQPYVSTDGTKCGWFKILLQVAPAMTNVTHVVTNTVLATVLPVLSIVFTLLVCLYMKAYTTHIKREIFMRQQFSELREINEVDSEERHAEPLTQEGAQGATVAAAATGAAPPNATTITRRR